MRLKPHRNRRKSAFAPVFLSSEARETVLAEQNRAATCVENISGRDSRTCAILFGNPCSGADSSQGREGAMAQVSPIIQDGILTYQLDGQPAQLVVDSADWYGWLAAASTFTFRSEDGSFTAHKERAGNRRGRSYWRAYCTRGGQLQRIYLGQSEALTLPRLQAVAARLFSMRTGETALAVQAQDLEAAPRPPAASS